MPQTTTPQPEPPKRLRAGDVIEQQAALLERLATKTPYTAEPKIELDYKKAPGDTGPRTTWHLEIPAGFDDDEANRIYRKACELHEALLQKYAPETAAAILNGDREEIPF